MTDYSVAIVGRANVGKSTLFNKLINQQHALVSPIAGTTRDRLEATCSWQGLDFTLIDTGGFDIIKSDPIEEQILVQTTKAIKEADLVIFLVDTNSGLMPLDKDFAIFLKKHNKNILLVANKADTLRKRDLIANFYQLGCGEPIPISAASGSGSGDLLDLITANLKKIKIKKKIVPEAIVSKPIKIIFLGQPNVGKSSLINAILNEERVIATPIPHTTRGVQTIDFKYKGKNFQLLDSAGLRRRHKKSELIEKFSIEQIKTLLPQTDIALLIIDVNQNISVQDKKISKLISDHNVNVIIVANKWDLVPDKDENTINKYVDYFSDNLAATKYAPIIFTSALEKQRVRKILDIALTTYQERFRRIDDNAADKFLKWCIKKSFPKKSKGVKQPYLIDFKQVATDPPRFKLRKDAKSVLAPAYIKFLIKMLREKFGFLGTPVKIEIEGVDLSHKHKKNIKPEKI
ncbi:MAG: ribosome biogenesis GTPase Der [Parcubacteria group bacterium CG1_02_37_51]|uniref:GTPase Der n=2 Tax=Candidatus Komeiliibacteriota TaxID=1817908 RepID=A0A2M8DQU0_9BACT|nr:MAG: ribosome biogenesis GTPase Der [Parcubacteria group bacterium CG1_02_37_51]PIY95289.1 MAG: ribosome biogenesis GTPase Der [Candidatus Komeilibacteria bacterium CG_4_10_14_0_8_um_filter_37_78]PJC01534.1 MAG: ribosome biogenesis GTPase Der [Candidatus Komeilibacteria bacterium CG_4_9_14_0_8_um_filter_36_9]